MPKKNEMEIQFASCSTNEAFSRTAVSAFISQLDPTVEELYGYSNGEGKIVIRCSYEDREVTIVVNDQGQGIKNVEEAMTPLYTTSLEEERAGLGFTVMQSMMDSIEVSSKLGSGTTVKMKKSLAV